MSTAVIHIAEENECWQQLKQGNTAAYQQLYNAYMPQLYNYGYRFTKDATLIEDAIHDLFCTLWSGRERLGTPASVKNYLFKSLRTTLYKKFQKNKHLVYNGDDILDFHFDISVDQKIIETEKFRQLKQDVEKALNSLTARQREIIYYRFYQNMEFTEIAEMMDMQLRATYKLTARALDALRSKICPVAFVLFILPPLIVKQ